MLSIPDIAELAVRPKFPVVPNDKRTDFITEIRKAVQLYKSITFGSPAGSSPGAEDANDKYDKEYWSESILDSFNWTLLSLRPGKIPSEAIKAIQTKTGIWALDCARFTQLVLMTAKMAIVGEKKTDTYYKKKPAGTFTISPHESHFLDVKKFTKKLFLSPPSPYVNGFTNQELTITEQQLLSQAPLGSICTFTNKNAPGTAAFRSENSIKVDADLFVGFGFGNPPANLEYTSAKIKELLALSQDNTLNGPALTTYIGNNLFLNQVQEIE